MKWFALITLCLVGVVEFALRAIVVFALTATIIGIIVVLEYGDYHDWLDCATWDIAKKLLP